MIETEPTFETKLAAKCCQLALLAGNLEDFVTGQKFTDPRRIQSLNYSYPTTLKMHSVYSSMKWVLMRDL